VITSWFQAVTPRTAGFNTIDFADVEDSTILMTMLLMFIGGGSASTASGIKLSTFIVIVLAVVAFLRGRTEPRAFDRRIATETVYKAMSVTAISALLLGFGMFVLVAIEPEPLVELVFEAVSAFGTVGLSLGVTPDLHAPGQLVICMLMFAGRIGPLSLVFVLARRQSSRISYPKGDVLTG
jgi:trk system potassium uptake protein TrkH